MKLSHLFKSVLTVTALSLVTSSVSAENIRLRFHTFFGSEMDTAAKHMQDTLREKSDNKSEHKRPGGGFQADECDFRQARDLAGHKHFIRGR